VRKKLETESQTSKGRHRILAAFDLRFTTTAQISRESDAWRASITSQH